MGVLNSPFDVGNNSSLSTRTNNKSGLTGLASDAGAPTTDVARKIAADNGIENMRSPGDKPIEVQELYQSCTVKNVLANGSAMNGNRDIASGAINGKVSAGVRASAGAFSGLRQVSAWLRRVAPLGGNTHSSCPSRPGFAESF